MLLDPARKDHKQPDYLRLNPNGLIPVLTDGDLVLYETAAIVLHLCDTHPQAGLAPALGSKERAEFYKWLCWLANTLHPTLVAWFYPERWVKEGNTEGAAEVKAKAQEKVDGLIDQLEALVERITTDPVFLKIAISPLSNISTLRRFAVSVCPS